MTVPVTVVRGKSGVQVFVPVTIHGKRFYFLLDTGATVTFLDSTVTKSLQLAAVGGPGKGTSIGCTSPVQPVAIDRWSIAGQTLPGSVIPSEKTDLGGKTVRGVPIAGLLGADLFYLYGTLTVDYRRAEISLGKPAPAGKQSFPFTSVVNGASVSVVAQISLHGAKGGFVVDTGASVTEMDTAFATRAGLQKAGPTSTIGAVNCSTTVQPVRFAGASVGAVQLPTVTAVSSKSSLTTKSKGTVQGLLGSDILAGFGVVTFDFLRQKIILG